MSIRLSYAADTMGDVTTRTGTLVGRSRELGVLTAALAAASAGEPRAVLVSGDAGVGKTRLLDELVARAREQGAVAVVGHCLNVGGLGLPYLAFSEALTALGSDLRLGAAGGGDVGQLQLFDAVATALAAAAQERPVLLVLEDLHWADQSTRDLLAFLLARAREERLLVVGSYRADDLHRRHPLRPLLTELIRLPSVERLDLAPFDYATMAAYLSELQGSPVPQGTVLRILDRSEGNAYFAQELLESEQAGRDGLPPALADVLLARVESLPPAVQQVARVATVAGRRVGHDLLRRVSDLPDVELEQALREAVTHQVLVPDGDDSYAFRHALLQEAVYADLLPGERVRLHGRYAQAVEDAGGPAALLAHHRVESHDVPGAFRASLLAADEAERLRAPAEAWQQLERALRLWSAVPDAEASAGIDLPRLTMRAAAKASAAGELHRAVALAKAAVQALPTDADPERVATLHHRLAHHLANADQLDPAVAAALEAVRVAPPGTPSAAWGAATAARALYHVSRHDEARAFAEQARGTAVALGLPDAEADALVSLARLDALSARAGHVPEQLALAAERAREAGHVPTEVRATFSLISTIYDSGDVRRALDLLDRALARCAELGVTWSPYGLELRALKVVALFVVGDWADSRQAAKLAGARPPDAMAARLSAAALFATVASGAPEAAAAVQRLESDWHHDPLIALYAGANQAELLRWREEPAAAIEVVDRVLRHVDGVWGPWYLAGIWMSAVGIAAAADLHEQAVLQRDVALQQQARGAADRLRAHARTTAERGVKGTELGPEGRAWLLRAEAEHSRLAAPGDAEVWERTLKEFGYGHVYEQARAGAGLAAALLVADRRDEGEQALRAALATAVQLGAVPLQRSLEQLARRARIDVGAPAASATAGLTPRELEVVRQLAAGRTNREIGEQLYISQKTASVHVSNILAKLGARSRAEAVSLAHRAGLIPPS